MSATACYLEDGLYRAASYSLALIAIDSAAFSYQLSDLKAVCRLKFLRLAALVFLDRVLCDLRSGSWDTSRFTPE
jgi:hypothetical protein